MSNEDDESNTCVVCFKNAEFYSVGQCDHPVCYECSTRMRVLCQQTECPICRQDMPKVIFATEVRPFRRLRERGWERKYKIGFANEEVEEAYRHLLQHSCKLCEPKLIFKSFGQLKDHMRREHELHYCDLCVDNLKIFSFERRCYKRAELGQHRRKGDVDDRSHRGHPLCEFCDERFMDNDELFRHLRRNHLFCHFCDADGYHRYYGSYDYLREHFRNEHYLCEEGDCKEEKFTAVFRSDIDLKAHRASVHGRALGKAATKQARTLELEFTLAPRPKPNAPAQRRPHTMVPNIDAEGAVGYTGISEPAAVPSVPTPDTMCPDNFPTLSGEIPTIIGSRSVQYRGNTRFNMTEENFPALHGSAPNQTVNISLQRGSSQRPTANNLSIQVKHRSTRSDASPRTSVLSNLADFPSLGTPTNPPPIAKSWKGTVAPRNNNNEISKVPDRLSKNSCTSSNNSNNGSTGKNTTSVNSNTSPAKASGSAISVKPSVSKSTAVSVKPAAPKSTAISVKPPNALNSTSDAKNSSEVDESKSGGSKSKKKKSKGGRQTSPTTSNQSVPQTSTTPQSSSSENVTVGYSSPVTKPKSQEQRKCSELKIGELREEQTTITTPRAPPAPSLGPPPGFSSITNHLPSTRVIMPPPGFSVTLNSVARPANSLTFTNSCGESFPIRQTAGEFQPPASFEQRNLSLVRSVSQALQQRKEFGGLSSFKQLSSQFRQGLIQASEYYEKCKECMGEQTFTDLFPELLALLPDIRKQQELWRAHGRKGDLEECRTCGQVVRSSDAHAHVSSHVLDSHFPALNRHDATTVPSWPLTNRK